MRPQRQVLVEERVELLLFVSIQGVYLTIEASLCIGG